MTQAPPPRREGLAYAALCAALGLLLYAGTASYGYLGLDDTWLVRDNAELQQSALGTVERLFFDLSPAFRARMGAEYLPVRDLSVMAQFATGAGTAQGFHVAQVVLYALLSGLFVWVTFRFSRDARFALCAGLLFVAHPLHVEAVAWISERKGLLAACLTLCAALTFQRFRESLYTPGTATSGAKVGWWVATGICLVGSVWSKAVGVTTLPLLVLLGLAFPLAPTGSEPLQRERPPSTESRAMALALALWGALVVLAMVPILRTGNLVHMVQEHPPVGTKLRLFATVVGHYASQLLPSRPHAVHYPLDRASLSPALTNFGALLLLLLSGVVLRGLVRVARTRSLRVSAAELVCAGVLVTLLPVSHLLAPLQNVVADRYMLLPSMPLAWGAASLFARALRPNLVLPVTVALAGAFSVVTVQHVPNWRSDEALYEQALRVSPHDPELLVRLAVLARSSGAVSLASRRLDAAQQACDRRRSGRCDAQTDIWMHRGLLAARQHHDAEALMWMGRAAEDPTSDIASANLAHLLIPVDPPRALEAAERAVAIRPNVARNHGVYGRACLAVGRPDLAERAFRAAIALAPYDAEHHFNLGVSLLGRGPSGDAAALVSFREALRLDPSTPNAREAIESLRPIGAGP